MVVQIRTIVLLVVLVAIAAGAWFVQRAIARQDACFQIVDQRCPPEERRGACQELRSRLRSSKSADSETCAAAANDPILEAELEDVREQSRLDVTALPFEQGAWAAALERRGRSCEKWADALANTGDVEALVEAARAHEDVVACTLALGRPAQHTALRTALAAKLVAATYDGSAPCEELARRATLLTAAARAPIAGGYLVQLRCAATLTPDALAKFAATEQRVANLVEVEIDPGQLPWIDDARAQLARAARRACRRQPTSGDRTSPAFRAELSRRCRGGLLAMVRDDARFVVDEVSWISPGSIGREAGPLEADAPWAEGSVKPKLGGRLTGGCAELGLKLCSDREGPRCERAMGGITDQTDERCAALALNTSALQDLLETADHEPAPKARSRLKLPRAWKSIIDPTRCPTRSTTTFYLRADKPKADVIGAVERALKRARIVHPPISPRRGTAKGKNDAGLSVVLEVGSIDDATSFVFLSEEYEAPRRGVKRSRRGRRRR